MGVVFRNSAMYTMLLIHIALIAAIATSVPVQLEVAQGARQKLAARPRVKVAAASLACFALSRKPWKNWFMYLRYLRYL